MAAAARNVPLARRESSWRCPIPAAGASLPISPPARGLVALSDCLEPVFFPGQPLGVCVQVLWLK